LPSSAGHSQAQTLNLKAGDGFIILLVEAWFLGNQFLHTKWDI